MFVADLKKIPLFKNFSKAALKTLSELVNVKTYGNNRLIFKEGRIRDRLFVLLDGRVMVEKEILGQQEPLAVFKPYDVLGETIIYSPGGRHNHSGKSYGLNSKIMELSVYNLLKLFKTHPETSILIHQYFIETLSQRLSKTNDKLLTLFATGKLAINFRDKEHLINSMLTNILKLFSVKKALLTIYDGVTRRIVIEGALGYSELIPKIINLDSDTLLSIIFNTRSSLMINPKTFEKKFESANYATKHMLLVPIKTKASTIGCLAIADRINKHSFDLNDELLLNAIAEQISPSLETLQREELERNSQSMRRTFVDPFYA